MKNGQKIFAAVVITMMSSFAFADPSAQKPVTRIDFNKMIDEGNTNKNQLQKTVDEDIAKQPVVGNRIQEDKAKVLDFIDVEIGLSEQRPVVDRRFNSVGEPRIAKVSN